MKYARREREHRFLLDRAPKPAEGAEALQLEDRYLTGTRLRLRLVRRAGREPAYKLGQKIQVEPDHPSTVAHTTLYLDRREYETLHRLAGTTLRKTRTLHPWDGLTLAVDVFAGELEGLVLAEVDVGEAAGASGALPLPAGLEVTDDERFTGAALAGTGAEQLRRALSDVQAGRGHRSTPLDLPGEEGVSPPASGASR